MNDNIIYRTVTKYKVSKTLFVTYCAVLSTILYFLFFGLFGPKGLWQMIKLQEQVKNEEASRKEIITKMNSKKELVKRMENESLDVDLLDEQARKVLGYAGKNEVVLYKEKEEEK